MNAIATMSNLYYHAELHYDEDPPSPREGWNLSTIVCDHGRYDLGDTTFKSITGFNSPQDFTSPDHIENYIEMRYNTLAFTWLGLLDHSGLHIYMGRGPHWSDSAGWDSGTIGFAFVSRATAIQCWGSLSEGELKDRSEVALAQEVKTYDDYLRGEVYGYTISLENGEVVDSCWGFYGYNDASESMELALDEIASEAPEQLAFNFEDRKEVV